MPTTLSNRLVRILQVVYRRVRYGYWEPIEANLEAFLKTTLLASHSIDIIQVGANDGVTHDLVYSFLQEKMLHRAVLVEPLPEAFSRLRSLHQGNPKITLENIAIAGKVSEQLFNFMPHIALSSGSACTSGTIERSHVLSAMKLPDNRIDGSFRISTGRNTTKDEVKELINCLSR